MDYEQLDYQLRVFTDFEISLRNIYFEKMGERPKHLSKDSTTDSLISIENLKINFQHTMECDVIQKIKQSDPSHLYIKSSTSQLCG